MAWTFQPKKLQGPLEISGALQNRNKKALYSQNIEHKTSKGKQEKNFCLKMWSSSKSYKPYRRYISTRPSQHIQQADLPSTQKKE